MPTPTSQQQAELVDTLRQLADGQLDPDAWLAWWEQNNAWVAQLLKRGQWLRLKPIAPGAWGPACRSALVSQTEACLLLEQWGVPVEKSSRYETEWNEQFQRFCAQQDAAAAQRRRLFLPQIKQLETEFPKFSRFLAKRIELIEDLAPPATENEIAACERSIGRLLPAPLRSFLLVTQALELGEVLKFGLPFVFVPNAAETTSALNGLLCFGECWIDADGDQVYFGRAWSQIGSDPPILYYSHSASPPATRELAADFTTWLEKIVPSWKSLKNAAK